MYCGSCCSQKVTVPTFYLKKCTRDGSKTKAALNQKAQFWLVLSWQGRRDLFFLKKFIENSRDQSKLAEVRPRPVNNTGLEKVQNFWDQRSLKWDKTGLFETKKGWERLLETAQDCTRLFETKQEYMRLNKIKQGYTRLIERNQSNT